MDSTTPAKLSAAKAQAGQTGKPVAVDALTSQTSTTMANPDGSFTTSTTTVPTRIMRNGAWIPVDTGLKVQADGSLSPAAVPAPVTFSGGGNQPMVTQASGSTTYRASWPGTLPKPTIAGDTATYGEVLPGVDLKLTATVTGVQQVLVVKTKAAAANPALAALNFPVNVSGGTMSTDADGSLSVLDASGTPVLHGGAPTMWDSSGSATEAAAAPGQAPSGARFSLMGLKAPAKAASTTVTVTPDASLLANPAAVFPLILDPDTSFTHLAAYDTVWDVAPDSNYLNNGSSLRSGYVWDGTNSRYQTNRSFLNFDGLGVISGKTVRSASLLLFDSYSASCSGTAVSLWATGSISTSTTWRNEPSWAYKMDDKTFAHGYTSSCPGAQVSMNPIQQVTNAANGGWANITMGLRADNESDSSSWKIFESVKAGYAPDLIVTWTSPAVAPQITSVAFGNTTVPCGGWAGKVSDLNASPLLVHANVFGDAGGDFLKVWTNVTDNHNNAALSQTQNVYTSGIGSAVPWTSPGFNESWLQADSSTITVTVSATNLANQPATSAACTFQVDTVTPGSPSVTSPFDFPVEDWGNTLTQGGSFNVTPGANSGHVVKYHIVADGNANSYWDQGTTNGAASGFGLNCSGCAYNPFTTPGLHWLTAQSVSVAGNLSNLSPRYYFFISPNSPQADAATGLTNASVNTTVATGPQQVTDAYGTYNQVLLWGAPNGAGLWLKDTPADSGNYAVQAVMTKATDYGKVQASVTQLDGSGNPIAGTTQTLPQIFDGDSGSCCSRATFDFGGANLSKGTAYRFTFTASGTSSTVSPYYNIGVYQLRLIPLHVRYTGSTDPNANLASGFNNIGITDSTTVANGDFDGSGNSLDATGLANAGYGPGQKITIDGVPFTIPTAAAGTADDMVASGQTIGMGNATGSAIGLLGSLSYTARGGTGQITYNGTCNGATTQAYTIAPVPDWGDTSASAADRAAVSGLPWNSSTGWGARSNRLYSIIIPLNCQNVPVASIDLPAVSPSVAGAASSLKIFSIGMRPATKGSAYVASWATSLDTTAAVPAGTLRMPVHVSIGGTSTRIRLDNPYATAPITISAAGVGLQSTGAGTSATPTALTFAGSGSVTIPPGGQVYSDPAGLTVPSGSTLLVSLDLPSAATVAAHAATRATVWTAAGNATGASAATGFTTTATGWALLDDVEVTPAAGQYQLGTLAIMGDQIGNGDQTAVDANARISDYIAKALPGTAGVVNVSSTGNRLLTDEALGSGGPSALSRLDRDVCDLPNLNTVVVAEGDNDLHDGQSDVAIEGNAAGGLSGISQILQHCGATPLIVPVTPFDTAGTWNATGEPGYWNGIRAWTTAGNLPGAIIADGGATSVLSDSADARKLAAAYDNADHAMPNDAGLQLLATTITAATPWKTVPSGASDWFTLTADGTDALNSTYNGIPSPTVNFIANDRGSRTAARFNGTDSTINIPDPNGLTTNAPLDTTQSFTVSAWVDLTSSPRTDTESLVAQNGTNEFGYELAFQRSSQQWRFGMQAADGTTGNDWEARGPVMNGSEYGSWHHLVGVYDATAQKIYLYVDGTLTASTNFHATVNFAQNMTIGGGALWQGTPTDYLNGDISDVILYTSALNSTQVQNLYTATLPQ
ncbi:LamG-like jellyroll fold domain-containing protein [Catenulispora rubra]|uniref:LamG-like jellyroll fold domain-containing protein n=1 Tax=Catenulispora rubra TaxID=280293 RepID=UPI00189237B1|nr:LamG-like jellyroll fold domain-containing protein [Catenulispora rubra]